MATALDHLEFPIAYVNSPTPKTLPYTQKLLPYLVQKLKYVQFWLIFV